MPDRIAGHYERHAHAFDHERRKRFVERAWIDRFLLGVPKGAPVLDLGCGAGEPIARYLIDRRHPVTGVDLSEEMIALCRTRFPRERWLVGDMRKLALDTPFGGIVAWDSAFHLPADDQLALIARLAPWLVPGGALLFNTGDARGTAIGQQFGEELYHASADPAEYRAVFARTGLFEVAFAPSDAATGRAVWLVRKPH
ncbi:class I SAM-dependent methyltransferase [Sphingomonas sp. KR3-1]|uniref:class I SAM-dependent methyltransferase n=1 Tax=Sphingomonas sp. KR3-1 TaxID=3156611 RepID=UPI0032B4D52A